MQEFEDGDLVLRKVEHVKKPQGEGKLVPNWEGPYQVIRKIGREAYKIAELGGRELLRIWNMSLLRKYFT